MSSSSQGGGRRRRASGGRSAQAGGASGEAAAPETAATDVEDAVVVDEAAQAAASETAASIPVESAADATEQSAEASQSPAEAAEPSAGPAAASSDVGDPTPPQEPDRSAADEPVEDLSSPAPSATAPDASSADSPERGASEIQPEEARDRDAAPASDGSRRSYGSDAAPQAPAGSGGGGGGSAIWGVAGGGVGAAVALFLAPMFAGDDGRADLMARIGALETRIEASESGLGARLDEAASAAAPVDHAHADIIAAVDQELADAVATLDRSLADTVAAVDERMAALDVELAALVAAQDELAAATDQRLAAFDALPADITTTDGAVDTAALLGAVQAAIAGQERLAEELRAERDAAAAETDAQLAAAAVDAETRIDAAIAALADDLAAARAELETVAGSAEGGVVELGQDVEALGLRVDEVAGGLEALGAGLAGVAAESMAADETAAERMDGLDAAMTSMTEASITPEDLAALEERVLRAEAAASSALGRGSSVGVALAELSRRLEGAQPYARELDLLGEAVLMGLEQAPGVDADGVRRSFDAPDALAAPADAGLASPVTLAERFDAAARAALAAANRVTADESGGIFDRLSTVMVVRRTDWTEGPEPDAVLARAQTLVAAGDFAGAVAEIDALGARRPEHDDDEAALAERVGDAARAAEPMADWLAMARERVAAETALADLYARLLNVSEE